jgi:hypothetical protein
VNRVSGEPDTRSGEPNPGFKGTRFQILVKTLCVSGAQKLRSRNSMLLKILEISKKKNMQHDVIQVIRPSSL